MLNVNLNGGTIFLYGKGNAILAFLIIKLNRSGELKVMRVIKGFTLVISFTSHELVSVEIERESACNSWAVLVLCL